MQAFGEFVIIRDLDPWGSGHFTVKPQPSQERNAPEAQSQRAHIPGPAQDTSTQTTAPRASAASVDRVVFSSQLFDYQHRGAPLREWCWYFYVAGVARVPAQATNQSEVFEFAATHPHSRQSAQRVICRSASRVPQLVGPTFPATDSGPERRALMFLVLFRPWLGPPRLLLTVKPLEAILILVLGT